MVDRPMLHTAPLDQDGDSLVIPLRPQHSTTGSPWQLCLTGDWCPVRSFASASERSPEELFGPLLPLLRNADCTVTNLELPLIKGSPPARKEGAVFCGQRADLDCLRSCGIEVVTMANNHALDQGLDGLAATLDACASAGLHCSGAGINAAAARDFPIVTIADCRIGLAAIADRYGGRHQWDTIATIDDPRVVAACCDLRQRCDVLILMPHGGEEYTPVPSPRWLDHLRSLQEVCQADAVIGHHPHVPQGAMIQERQQHSSVPWLPSLGNFLFPPRPPDACKPPQVALSLIAVLEGRGQHLERLRLVPATIDGAHGLRPLNKTFLPDMAHHLSTLGAIMADPLAHQQCFAAVAAHHWHHEIKGRLATFTPQAVAGDSMAAVRTANSHRSAAWVSLISCALDAIADGDRLADCDMLSDQRPFADQVSQWYQGRWPANFSDHLPRGAVVNEG